LTSNEIKRFFGAIVIADALGTKGKWLKRDPLELIKEYKKLLKDATEVIKGMERHSNSTETSISPYIITISDTIIAIFEGSRNNALYYASIWSTYLTSLGLIYKIPFRGGLGYGEIFFDKSNNIIIGPTIDEVAEWHDKGQIIGIYATPSALLHNYEPNKKPYGVSALVKYSVKMKNLFSYDTWITNWPEYMKAVIEQVQNENGDDQEEFEIT